MSRTPPSGGLHPEISLAHEQEWELYHNSFSLCSKKLRVCLAELGLPYRSHHVHLIETGWYENVSREFLAVNPGGTVPVLVHRGHPVYESHDQIVYAAQHAGERGRELLPEEVAARALVEQWSDCASLVGNPLKGTGQRAGHCVPGLTLPLFATMVRAIPYSQIFKGLLTHPNKERPLLFALLKAATIARVPKLAPMIKLLRKSRRDMETHLDALGTQLDKHGGPWITGEAYTLADVSWVVILDRLVEADWEEFFWGRGQRPSVAAYWERSSARPSFASEIEGARCSATRAGIKTLSASKRSDPRLFEALEGASAG